MDNDETFITVSTYDISNINDSSGIAWFNSAENQLYINNGTDWISQAATTVEWEDTLPDLTKIKEMCNEYPALEKAYENFKTVYKMVEQDWAGKQKADRDSLF